MHRLQIFGEPSKFDLLVALGAVLGAVLGVVDGVVLGIVDGVVLGIVDEVVLGVVLRGACQKPCARLVCTHLRRG